MSNRNIKPLESSSFLINEKLINRGVTFNYKKKEDAIAFIENNNNYFRITSYRKNFQKFTDSENHGKFIDLDFSYLQELSTLDMHFRYLVIRMCLDIEHSIKLYLLNVIEKDQINEYQLVEDYIKNNPIVNKKLCSLHSNRYTLDLLNKYFTFTGGHGQKKLVAYDNCPPWVLFELLTFGDLVYFYKFYHDNYNELKIDPSVLNLVRSLRNACAHNNCTLMDIVNNTSSTSFFLSTEVSKIKEISKSLRNKRLSNRTVLEFVAVLFVYKEFVGETIKKHRVEEIDHFLNERAIHNKEYFKNNPALISVYKFISKIVKEWYFS